MGAGVEIHGNFSDDGEVDYVHIIIANETSPLSQSARRYMNVYLDKENNVFYSSVDEAPQIIGLPYMGANYVWVEVVDKAGNKAYSDKLTIYQDKQDPEFLGTRILNDNLEDITNKGPEMYSQYGNNITFEITLEDTNWTVLDEHNNSLEMVISNPHSGYKRILKTDDFVIENNYTDFSYEFVLNKIGVQQYEERPGKYYVNYTGTDRLLNKNEINRTFQIRDERESNITIRIIDPESGREVDTVIKEKKYLVELDATEPIQNFDKRYFDTDYDSFLGSKVYLDNLQPKDSNNMYWNATFKIENKGVYTKQFEDVATWHITFNPLVGNKSDKIQPKHFNLDMKGPEAPSFLLSPHLYYNDGVYYSTKNVLEVFGFARPCNHRQLEGFNIQKCTVGQNITVARSQTSGGSIHDWETAYQQFSEAQNNMTSYGEVLDDVDVNSTSILIGYNGEFEPGKYIMPEPDESQYNYNYYLIEGAESIETIDGMQLNITVSPRLSEGIGVGDKIGLFNSSVPQGWYGSDSVPLIEGDNYLLAYGTDENGNKGPNSEVKHVYFSNEYPKFILGSEYPINRTYTNNNLTNISVAFSGEEVPLNLESMSVGLDGGIYKCWDDGIYCNISDDGLRLRVIVSKENYGVLMDGRHNVTVTIANYLDNHVGVEWHFFVDDEVPNTPNLIIEEGKHGYLDDPRWYVSNQTPEMYLNFPTNETVNISNMEALLEDGDVGLDNLLLGWNKTHLDVDGKVNLDVEFGHEQGDYELPYKLVIRDSNETGTYVLYNFTDFVVTNFTQSFFQGDGDFFYTNWTNFEDTWFYEGFDTSGDMIESADPMQDLDGNLIGPEAIFFPQSIPLTINVSSEKGNATVIVFVNNGKVYTSSFDGSREIRINFVNDSYNNIRVLACDGYYNCNLSSDLIVNNSLPTNMGEFTIDDYISEPFGYYPDETFNYIDDIGYNLYAVNMMEMGDPMQDYIFNDNHYELQSEARHVFYGMENGSIGYGPKGFYRNFWVVDTEKPLLEINSDNITNNGVYYSFEAGYDEKSIESISFSGDGLRFDETLHYYGSILDNHPAVESREIEKSLALSEGDGVKNILIRLDDKAGNSEVIQYDVLVDTKAPFLNISTEQFEGEYWTNESEIVLGGTTEENALVNFDGNYQSPVQKLAENYLFTSGGKDHYGFNFSFGLVEVEEGYSVGEKANRINITSKDRANNSNTSRMDIYYDNHAPALSYQFPMGGTIIGDTRHSIKANFDDLHGIGVDKGLTKLSVTDFDIQYPGLVDVTNELEKNTESAIIYDTYEDISDGSNTVDTELLLGDKLGNSESYEWSFDINPDVPKHPNIDVTDKRIHENIIYTKNNHPRVQIIFPESVKNVEIEESNFELEYLYQSTPNMTFDYKTKEGRLLSTGKYYINTTAELAHGDNLPEGKYYNSFVVDTELPYLTIDKPVTKEDYGKHNLSGACGDNYGIDRIDLEIIGSPLTEVELACSSERYSFYNDLSEYADENGFVTINLTAYDYAGNAYTILENVDAVPPEAPDLHLSPDLVLEDGVYYTGENSFEVYGNSNPFRANCDDALCYPYGIGEENISVKRSDSEDNHLYEIIFNQFAKPENSMLDVGELSSDSQEDDNVVVISDNPEQPYFNRNNYLMFSKPLYDLRYYNIVEKDLFQHQATEKYRNLTLRPDLTTSFNQGDFAGVFANQYPEGWYGGDLTINPGENWVSAFATDTAMNKGDDSHEPPLNVIYEVDNPRFVPNQEYPLNGTFTNNPNTNVSAYVTTDAIPIDMGSVYMKLDDRLFNCSDGLSCNLYGDEKQLKILFEGLDMGLTEGKHTVNVVVGNILGQKSSKEWQFFVDLDVPHAPKLFVEGGNNGFLNDNRWYVANKTPQIDMVFLDEGVEVSSLEGFALNQTLSNYFVYGKLVDLNITWIETDLTDSSFDLDMAHSVFDENYIFEDNYYRVDTQASKRLWDDSLGNDGYYKNFFTVDNVEPAFNITSENLTNSFSYKLGIDYQEKNIWSFTISGDVVTDKFIDYKSSKLDNDPGVDKGEFEEDIELTEHDGKKEIVVTAKDKAGNKFSKNFTIVLDTKAPDVEIISPVDETVLNKKVVFVNGTLDESGYVSITHDFMPVAEQEAKSSVGGKFAFGLNVGHLRNAEALRGEPNIINITGYDLAGNHNTIYVSVYVDNEEPEVLYKSPYHPEGIVIGDKKPLIKAAFDDVGLGIDIHQTRLYYNDLGDAINPALHDFTPNLSINTDSRIMYESYGVDTDPIARKNVRLKLEDKADNTNNVDWSFTVDPNVPNMPSINFTNETIHNFVKYTPTRYPLVKLNFEEPVTNLEIESDANLVYGDNEKAEVYEYLPNSHNEPLEQGEYYLEAVAKKAGVINASYGGPYSQEFIVDTEKPDILTIDTPGRSVSDSKVTVSGRCHDNFGISYIEVSIPETDMHKSNIECMGGYYETVMPLVDESGEDGLKTIEVTAYDYVNHKSKRSKSVMVDLNPMQIMIESSTTSPSNTNGLMLDVTASEKPSKVEFYDNYELVSEMEDVPTSQFEKRINLGNDGKHFIHAIAYDSQGNPTRSNIVEHLSDTTPPQITSTSPMDNDIVSNVTKILVNIHDSRWGVGIDEDMTNIVVEKGEVSVSGQQNFINNGETLEFLADDTLEDGEYECTVEVYDRVGNYETSSFFFEINSSVPTIEITNPETDYYPEFYFQSDEGIVEGVASGVSNINKLSMKDELKTFISMNEPDIETFESDYVFPSGNTEQTIIGEVEDIDGNEGRRSFKFITSESMKLSLGEIIPKNENKKAFYSSVYDSWLTNDEEVRLKILYEGSSLENMEAYLNGDSVGVEQVSEGVLMGSLMLTPGRNDFELSVEDMIGNEKTLDVGILYKPSLENPILYSFKTYVNHSKVSFAGESRYNTSVGLLGNAQGMDRVLITEDSDVYEVELTHYSAVPDRLIVPLNSTIRMVNEQGDDILLSGDFVVGQERVSEGEKYTFRCETPGEFTINGEYPFKNSNIHFDYEVLESRNNFAFNSVNVLNYAYHSIPYWYKMDVNATDGLNSATTGELKDLFVDLEKPQLNSFVPREPVATVNGFSGFLSDNYLLNLSSLRLQVDEDVYTDDSEELSLEHLSTSPLQQSYFNITFERNVPFANGKKNVSFYIKDNAGNILEKDFILNVDLSVPDKPYLYLENNANNYTNVEDPEIRLSYTEKINLHDYRLEDSQGEIAVGLDENINNHTFIFYPENFLEDGLYTIYLTSSRQDGAGERIEHGVNFIVDTVNPVLNVRELPNRTNILRVNISGECSDNYGVDEIEISGELIRDYSPKCQDGRFSKFVTLEEGDGVKNVNVTLIDRAGNSVQDTVSTELDLNPPVIDLVVTPNPSAEGEATLYIYSNEKLNSIPNVEFDRHDATESCYYDGFSSDRWLYMCDLSVTHPDVGNKLISVNASDLFGNSAEFITSLYVDTVKPEIFNRQPLTYTNEPKARIAVEYFDHILNPDVLMELNGDNVEQLENSNAGTLIQRTVNQYYKTSFKPIFDLEEGQNNVDGEITDSVNNTNSLDWSFVYDPSVPTTPEIEVSGSNYYFGKYYANFTDIGMKIQFAEDEEIELLNVVVNESGSLSDINDECYGGGSTYYCNVTRDEGDYGVIVEARKIEDGNNGMNATYKQEFVVDTTNPTLVPDEVRKLIIEPEIRLTGVYHDANMKNIEFKGSLEVNPIEYWDVIPTAEDKSFMKKLNVTPFLGMKNLDIIGYDRAGNSVEHNYIIEYNITKPYLDMDYIPDVVNSTKISVSGRTQLNSSVDLVSMPSYYRDDIFVDDQDETYNVALTMDGTFSPSQMNISVGSNVVFENRGAETFEVRGPETFVLSPGDNYTYKVDALENQRFELYFEGSSIDEDIMIYANDLNDHFEFNNVELVPSDEKSVNILKVESNNLGRVKEFRKKVFCDMEDPEIEIISPGEGDIIAENRVSIKAELRDNYGINVSSIKLFVDGMLAEYNFNNKTNFISYNATLGLGEHEVEIQVDDIVGNRNTREWSFEVNTNVPGKPEVRIQYQNGTLCPLYEPKIWINFSEPVKNVYVEGIFNSEEEPTGNYGMPTHVKDNLYLFEPDEPLSHEIEINPHHVKVLAKKDVIGLNPTGSWSDFYADIDRTPPEISVLAVNGKLDDGNIKINNRNITVQGTYFDQGMHRIVFEGPGVNNSANQSVTFLSPTEFIGNFYLNAGNENKTVNIVAYDKLYYKQERIELQTLEEYRMNEYFAIHHKTMDEHIFELDKTYLEEPIVIIK